MKILHISITDKKATYRERDGDIVCGNSDYMIEFTFDKEWDVHTVKTARFIYGGRYQDVVFEGTDCSVPILSGVTSVSVGVYAGDLYTTTPAIIGCKQSILCTNGLPESPSDDVYAQILSMLGEGVKKSFDGDGTALNLEIKDNIVYYVSNYSTVNITVPAQGIYTAHIFIDFPADAKDVALTLPEGMHIEGSTVSTLKAGDSIELSIDSMGGIIAFRKMVVE